MPARAADLPAAAQPKVEGGMPALEGVPAERADPTPTSHPPPKNLTNLLRLLVYEGGGSSPSAGAPLIQATPHLRRAVVLGDRTSPLTVT